MVAIVRISFVFLVACSIGNSYAGWFGPSNYEECVFEKAKDAKSGYAAAIIADACRKKFPLKVKAVSSPKMQGLPPDALARIKLICKEKEPLETNTGPKTVDQYLKQYRREMDERPGVINCLLHNGNSDWTVTNVVVRLTELSSGNYFDNDIVVGDIYSPGGNPLSTTDMTINRSIVTGGIRTSIVSAKGFVQ